MNDEQARDAKKLSMFHLQFAWWSLLCFVILGITLEALHAFKIGWYLGPSAEIRRLLWTLAHAHGTLLSLVHAMFAFTYFALAAEVTRRRRFASALLVTSSVLLPGGFFLGGAFVFEGDPGLGVWLVPMGAIALLLTIFLTATDIVSRHEPTKNSPSEDDPRMKTSNQGFFSPRRTSE